MKRVRGVRPHDVDPKRGELKLALGEVKLEGLSILLSFFIEYTREAGKRRRLLVKLSDG